MTERFAVSEPGGIPSGTVFAILSVPCCARASICGVSAASRGVRAAERRYRPVGHSVPQDNKIFHRGTPSEKSPFLLFRLGAGGDNIRHFADILHAGNLPIVNRTRNSSSTAEISVMWLRLSQSPISAAVVSGVTVMLSSSKTSRNTWFRRSKFLPVSLRFRFHLNHKILFLIGLYRQLPHAVPSASSETSVKPNCPYRSRTIPFFAVG